jgi:hypothetical protein
MSLPRLGSGGSAAAPLLRAGSRHDVTRPATESVALPASAAVRVAPGKGRSSAQAAAAHLVIAKSSATHAPAPRGTSVAKGSSCGGSACRAEEKT